MHPSLVVACIQNASPIYGCMLHASRMHPSLIAAACIQDASIIDSRCMHPGCIHHRCLCNHHWYLDPWWCMIYAICIHIHPRCLKSYRMHPPLIPNAVMILVPYPTCVWTCFMYICLPTCFYNSHKSLIYALYNTVLSICMSNTRPLSFNFPDFASIHVFPNLHKASGDSLTPPCLYVTSVNIITRQEAKTKDAILFCHSDCLISICHQTSGAESSIWQANGL